jgi:hypothetical protein
VVVVQDTKEQAALPVVVVVAQEVGEEDRAAEANLALTAQEDQAAPPPDKGKSTKGKSTKGKSTKGIKKTTKPAGEAGETADRRSHALTPEQEQIMVEWMAENEGVWRRGHRLYKQRKLLLATMAEKFDTTIEHLEGWWKSVKDWYVRLHHKKSGQPAKRHTDREKWILDSLSFYQGQLKKPEDFHQPMAEFARSHTSQPSRHVLHDFSDDEPEDEHEEPAPAPQQPTQSSSQPSADLEGLEQGAAQQARSGEQPGSSGVTTTTTFSSVRASRKRRRMESSDDAQMRELLDCLKANTTMITKMFEKPTSTGREPYITYIADTLRGLPDDQFEVARSRFNNSLIDITVPDQTAPPPPPVSSPAPQQQQYRQQQQQQYQHYGGQQQYQQYGGQQQQRQQPWYQNQQQPYTGQQEQYQLHQLQTAGADPSRDTSFTQMLAADDLLGNATLPNLSVDSNLGFSRSLNTPPAPIVTGPAAAIVTVTAGTSAAAATTASAITTTTAASSIVVTARQADDQEQHE